MTFSVSVFVSLTHCRNFHSFLCPCICYLLPSKAQARWASRARKKRGSEQTCPLRRGHLVAQQRQRHGCFFRCFKGLAIVLSKKTFSAFQFHN